MEHIDDIHRQQQKCIDFINSEKHFHNTLFTFIQNHREVLSLIQMGFLIDVLQRILSVSDYLILQMERDGLEGSVKALFQFSFLFHAVYRGYVDQYETYVKSLKEKMKNRTLYLSPNLVNIGSNQDNPKKMHHQSLYLDMIDFLDVPLNRVSEYVIWANYLFSIPENNQAEISKANDFFKEILDTVLVLHKDPDEMEIMHNILRKIDVELHLLNPRRRLLCQGYFIKKWGKQKKYRYFCFTDKFIYCEKVKLSKTLKYHNFFDINVSLSVKREGTEVRFIYHDAEYTLDLLTERDAKTLSRSIRALTPEEYNIEEDNCMFDILEHSSFQGFLQKKQWTATGLKLKRFFCQVKGKTIFCYNKEHHV
eukprot:TRINITY_DN4581_c0_g1_i2.p1 TRINITY_DN4581_c0_g1~~TRINITY_DN4581_c0_g1_i2.p1  ORF type:complete len:376 (-),score=77.41 TRINITY_DN4581_c0_g1_i2:252-1346(-)